MIYAGKFRNSEFGLYHLAAYRTCDSCIVITLHYGDVYVFNQKDRGFTQELYDSILERL